MYMHTYTHIDVKSRNMHRKTEIAGQYMTPFWEGKRNSEFEESPERGMNIVKESEEREKIGSEGD